jgi:hypothetical protein
LVAALPLETFSIKGQVVWTILPGHHRCAGRDQWKSHVVHACSGAGDVVHACSGAGDVVHACSGAGRAGDESLALVEKSLKYCESYVLSIVFFAIFAIIDLNQPSYICYCLSLRNQPIYGN